MAFTAEGKLILEEVRELLKRADEAVQKVRSLAQGQSSELHIGYAAAPTVEILPPVLVTFQKAFPRVNVVLHELPVNAIIAGLQAGTLELAVMSHAGPLHNEGIEFEPLQSYPLCVALPPGHPLTRLKDVPLAKVAAETLVGLRRKDSELEHRRKQATSYHV